MRTAGVFLRAGLPSSNERSAKKTSDSVDGESKDRSVLIAIVKDKEVWDIIWAIKSEEVIWISDDISWS